ncbi:hypothetical protein IX55_16070, partial [Paracoccus sanguinis]
MLPSTRATLIGALAVALWSGLALLTVATAPMPPFLLCAASFAIAGLAGLGWIAAGAGVGGLAGVPLRGYFVGTPGVFGFYALFFLAPRPAPPARGGAVFFFLAPVLLPRPGGAAGG